MSKLVEGIFIESLPERAKLNGDACCWRPEYNNGGFLTIKVGSSQTSKGT